MGDIVQVMRILQKKCIMENSSIIDPKKILEPARDAVRDQVIRRMRVLNT